MKKLNKVLCLVLALVMVLGCLAVTASATTLKDEASVNANYAEAVDVLNALGILEGYEDGNYYPTKAVTRAQAAKLAAYATMGTAAGKLADDMDDTVYTDMTGSSWANGYVNYCTSNGIVCGYNGKFRPTDTVTGYELCKMLLVAVGYGKNGEFEGTGWKSNVLKLAQNKGITIDGVDLAKNVTREEAAQYVFNAMTKVNTVAWSAIINDYVMNYDNKIASGSANNDTKATVKTLGLEYYDLTMVHGYAEGANQAAKLVWSDTCYLHTTQGDTTDTTYPVTTSIFDAGREGYIWVAGTKQLTDIYYTDGGVTTETYAQTEIRKGTTDQYTSAYENGKLKTGWSSSGANGRHTKIYAAASLVTVIKPTVTTAGTITTFVASAAQAKTNSSLTAGRTYVSIASVTDHATGAIAGTNSLYYVDADAIDYTGVAAGDVVTYVQMVNGKLYVAKCASYTGEYTSRTLKYGTTDVLTITVGGSVYSKSGLTGTTDTATTDEKTGLFTENINLNNGKQYIVWVDNGGYVVATEQVADPVAATAVAVLHNADAQIVSARVVKPNGDLVYAGGNGSIVLDEDMDKYYGNTADLGVDTLNNTNLIGTNLEGSLVDLVETAAGSGIWTINNNNSAVATVSTNATTIVTFNSTTVAPTAAIDLKLDQNTKFILNNGDGTYTTFTGLSNVPSIYVKNGDVQYIKGTSDDYADYVYIKAYKGAVTETANFFVLAIDTTTEQSVTMGDGNKVDVYQMQVWNIESGNQTVLIDKTLTSSYTVGEFYENNKLTQGVILVDNAGSFVNAAAIAELGNGVFSDGTTTYRYNEATVFVKIDGTFDYGVSKDASADDLANKVNVVVVSDGTTPNPLAQVVYIISDADAIAPTMGADITYPIVNG
jgi:hypothetical protein